MPAELPHALKRDLDAVLDILNARAPGQAHSIERFRRAIQAGSPVLYRRFHILVDNAFSGPDRHEFTREEQHEIGQLLVSLEEMTKTGRPGPKVRGNEYRATIYLTEEEHGKLTRYCERKGVTQAEAMRRGLDLLTTSAD